MKNKTETSIRSLFFYQNFTWHVQKEVKMVTRNKKKPKKYNYLLESISNRFVDPIILYLKFKCCKYKRLSCCKYLTSLKKYGWGRFIS